MQAGFPKPGGKGTLEAAKPLSEDRWARGGTRGSGEAALGRAVCERTMYVLVFRRALQI